MYFASADIAVATVYCKLNCCYTLYYMFVETYEFHRPLRHKARKQSVFQLLPADSRGLLNTLNTKYYFFKYYSTACMLYSINQFITVFNVQQDSGKLMIM